MPRADILPATWLTSSTHVLRLVQEAQVGAVGEDFVEVRAGYSRRSATKLTLGADPAARDRVDADVVEAKARSGSSAPIA